MGLIPETRISMATDRDMLSNAGPNKALSCICNSFVVEEPVGGMYQVICIQSYGRIPGVAKKRLPPQVFQRLEPWHHERDLALESTAISLGLDVRSFNAMVMKFEPWEAREFQLL